MNKQIQIGRLLIGGVALFLSLKIFKNKTLKNLALISSGINGARYLFDIDTKGTGF